MIVQLVLYDLYGYTTMATPARGMFLLLWGPAKSIVLQKRFCSLLYEKLSVSTTHTPIKCKDQAR